MSAITELKIELKSQIAKAKGFKAEERKANHEASKLRIRNRLLAANHPDKMIDRILKRRNYVQPGMQPAEAEWIEAHDAENARQHLIRVVVHGPQRRAANLAYGFMRGIPYARMEQKCYSIPDWDAVETIVSEFAEDEPQQVLQRFEQWLTEAQHPEQLYTKERVRYDIEGREGNPVVVKPARRFSATYQPARESGPRGERRPHRTLEEWHILRGMLESRP